MRTCLAVSRVFPATGVLAASLLLPVTLHAATPVYADPALSCAAQTPCFGTIQEAVNNAGPPPATVGIFPGTYAESVDLAAMGSAIGGGPGDITLQALDVTGQPAASGVLIDPDASGGPGTGPGISTGSTVTYDGDITVRGLSATSPDSVGIGLFMDGNLIVEDFLFDGADSSGMFALVNSGDATLARGTSRLNGGDGVAVAAEGTLTVTDVAAFRNTGIGLQAVGLATLFLTGVEASLNGDGLVAAACDLIDLRNVVSDMNTGTGTSVQYGPNECMTALDNGRLDLRAVRPFEAPGIDRLAAPVFREGIEGQFRGEQITASGNGIVGIGAASTTGSADLDGLFAYDNASAGIFLQASNLDLKDAEALRNRSGVVVLAGEASLLRVVGSESLPLPSNPPFEGTGVLVSATLADLDDIQADDNPLIGLLIAGPNGGSGGSFELIGSQFDGNQQGVASIGDGLVDVVVDDVAATANTGAGLTFPNLRIGSFQNVLASGNPLGLVFNVSGQLSVETSTFTNNETGVLAAVQSAAYARIGCSDLTANTQAGIELGLGDALDAPANWWSDASGPTHPGNPGGTGDAVIDGANGGVGTVSYPGFLAQPATGDDCPQELFAPVSVPVMNWPGLILLTALLGLLAVCVSRRRRSSARWS